MKALAAGTLWLATALTPTTAFAQHVDVNIYSSQNGAGALVAADFDFAAANPVFQSFCASGTCLLTTTDPGFRTPETDRLAESLFALDGGATVRLEIVAIHDDVSVKVGSTILDQPGESASLGTALGIHIHPEFQVIVPQGSSGSFPVSFKLTSSSYGSSPTYQLVLSNASPTPTPTATASPTPSPTPTPAATAASDTGVLLFYKARASRLDGFPANSKFPKSWNVQLDDTDLANDPPALHPDDPENHLVLRATGITGSAEFNAVPSARLDYLRYQIKGAAQGAGPADGEGKFPRAVRALPRLLAVENAYGSLFLETGNASSLLVPAGVSEGGAPPTPGDATHFLCYAARAARIPSDQAPDPRGKGKGTFRRDLQAFFLDRFDDCALAADGVSVPFAGTPVEGRCLLDLERPREICRPVAKTEVEPPRTTSAEIETSFPASGAGSLLCYAVKTAGRVRNADVAALGNLLVGDVVAQAQHVARMQKAGTAVQTAPGNGFPSPQVMDTKTRELACVPTSVLSVSNLP